MAVAVMTVMGVSVMDVVGIRRHRFIFSGRAPRAASDVLPAYNAGAGGTHSSADWAGTRGTEAHGKGRQSMRIITWNIQWGRGADGRVELARTIDAIRAMGGADIICLQEVARRFPGLAGGHGEDGVGQLAAAFPGYEVVFGAALDVPDGAGSRSHFGNLILSRMPVGQVFRHLLPCPPDPGKPSMQRGCVEAVVAAPWGPIRVLTTHLEYYSARQRGVQVGALRALQQEVAALAASSEGAGESSPAFASRPRPPSAVLCGDFNCEPGSETYLAMAAPTQEAPAWIDAWRLMHGERPHAPTVGLHGAEWPDRAYCCDYLWVTADLAPRVAKIEVNATTAASDHQPVLLELR
jgi:endonuclease/exonuclease/phosphatase family metal-dependent hydrolase